MPKTTDPNNETIAFRLTEILRRLNEGEKLDPHALAQSCQRDAALLAGGVA